MPNDVIKKDGQVHWIHRDSDRYIVTGVDVWGRRFPAMVFKQWYQAAGINVYRGTKWLLRDGKRIKLQEINN